VSVSWTPGFHAPGGSPVDGSAYERYVGRWSRLFVPALLSAAQPNHGDIVLDVAAGTGEASAFAAPAVGDSGFVVGTDISPAMLKVASQRLAVHPFLTVACDGQALPFRSNSFDAVLCQLGLMFFPDPLKGLIEFRRVLRRNRRASVCVISDSGSAPMWGILADELGREFPEQSQTLHMSFRLASLTRLRQLLVEAGFSDVNVTKTTREDLVASFEEYWEPIEAGIGQLPQAYAALPESRRRAVRANVRSRLAPFETHGRYLMSVEMLLGAGRA
jgi:ubiquinone/menaquinone biosynthesis C-methylase UbiE